MPRANWRRPWSEPVERLDDDPASAGFFHGAAH
jgi:hypothetical protein